MERLKATRLRSPQDEADCDCMAICRFIAVCTMDQLLTRRSSSMTMAAPLSSVIRGGVRRLDGEVGYKDALVSKTKLMGSSDVVVQGASQATFSSGTPPHKL